MATFGNPKNGLRETPHGESCGRKRNESVSAFKRTTYSKLEGGDERNPRSEIQAFGLKKSLIAEGKGSIIENPMEFSMVEIKEKIRTRVPACAGWKALVAGE